MHIVIPIFHFKNVQTKSFKNPFDIPRAGLIEQLRRMRLNFFHSTTASSKYDDEGMFLIGWNQFKFCVIALKLTFDLFIRYSLSIILETLFNASGSIASPPNSLGISNRELIYFKAANLFLP